jgi:hypothetical protein
VAQLVEHHLAKVRVAGSNPVVRSIVTSGHRLLCRLLPRENIFKWYDSAMRTLIVGTVITLALATSACGDDSPSNAAATTTTVNANVPDVVGLSVQEATTKLEAAGFTLRVVRRDGEELASTADFLENRVNVATETKDDGTEVVTAVVNIG